jgi:hypothetical protein
MTAPRPGDDAGKAMRFLALKAAIFILVPLAAAVLVVYWKLG